MRVFRRVGWGRPSCLPGYNAAVSGSRTVGRTAGPTERQSQTSLLSSHHRWDMARTRRTVGTPGSLLDAERRLAGWRLRPGQLRAALRKGRNQPNCTCQFSIINAAYLVRSLVSIESVSAHDVAQTATQASSAMLGCTVMAIGLPESNPPRLMMPMVRGPGAHD